MGKTENLLSRMNSLFPSFSKGQKKLATYINDNYDKAVFLTAAKLGEVVGVSESTVVRFAIYLGYKGYPEFQKALEELVRNKLNSIQRMEVTYGKVPQSEILETVLQSDIDKIKLTLEHMDQEAFEIAVDTILKAKRIYIVGIRSCAPLASFLSFYLNLIFDNVHLLQTNSASELFEQMIRIDEKDVIIGISFPRYSMRTLKAMEFANKRSAKVITLTDSIHSPMNLYSSCNLIARSDMASIVDSLVAPLSVVNALVVALCMKKQKDLESLLSYPRKDTFSGKELIQKYKEYHKNPTPELLELMLLHNYDDLMGMIGLRPLFSFFQLLNGSWTIRKASIISTETYEGTEEPELLITLDLLVPLPFPFSFSKADYYLTGKDRQARIKSPVKDGTLKLYFPNYQDYYYLPLEDTAIHKSIGCYVDKEHRIKATPELCYQKFECTEEFLEDPKKLLRYVRGVLGVLEM